MARRIKITKKQNAIRGGKKDTRGGAHGGGEEVVVRAEVVGIGADVLIAELLFSEGGACGTAIRRGGHDRARTILKT